MAFVHNEYFDGMPAGYGDKYKASRVADNIGTETKLRDTGNKPLNHRRHIAYTQRKGIVTILLLFILFTFIGIVLSGSYQEFNPSIFDDFQTYRNYKPTLPSIETVLQQFSGFSNGMSIVDFMNQSLITGNWDIFEPIRNILNVVSRPFVFVYALITNLFDMVFLFFNIFVV